jgi:hypothetical protein
VIVCVPTVSALVVKLAVLPEIGTAPLIAVPLSSKVIVPVAPAVTVAVRVTLVPKAEGFGAEIRVTVEAALFTTWDMAVDTAVV